MSTDKKYLTLGDDNFQSEVIGSAEPVMVDFWAEWCSPCKRIAPTVEELASEFHGQAKVGKVDVDANPATASQYGISSIPTLLFFKGGQVVDRVVGLASKKDLTEKLNSLLKSETATV